MSTIHINQIKTKIVPLFETFIDTSDLSEKDSQKEIKISTRCLAAYAVYNTVGCTPKEAAESVIDGGDDNGIDAIFYSQQFKQLVIVQSKWNQNGKGEPDSADISKFCQGIKDLFSFNYDRFNAKVASKNEMISTALNKYETKYKLILIDTSEASELAKHSQRLIDDLLKEINSTGDENTEDVVSFKRFNQGKIYSSLAKSLGNDPINLEVGISAWGMIKEPYLAYYGSVSALEIAKWWEDYDRRLFDKNIRQVLGVTDVNEEIEETLNNAPDKFWYYNNGITVIVEDIQKTMVGGASKDIGTFKLLNISIVNGAQTVSTIGKMFSEKNQISPDAKVLVKIISLKDASEDFGKKVTRANNRQNRIENRDFISQDPEQIRIRTELAIEGIEYHIVRSDKFNTSDKSFDLQEATIALACASGQTNLAVLAKSGIGKFFDGVESNKYKTLFNPTVDGLYVYHSVQANKTIEAIINECINTLLKKSGRKYGVLIHGNRIISLLSMQKLKYGILMKQAQFNIDKTTLEKTINTLIEDILEILEKHYPENILGTLFKSPIKCADLVQKCIKKWEQ